MSKRRSFTKEQKLQIFREGESEGMLATCRKHEIAQSLYYRWKHAFEQKGLDGLQGQYYRIDPETGREREIKENHWQACFGA